MSKLFKLKQWLTVEEAAIHLSSMLGEPVTQRDILRLALDKHLRISINFVNNTHGRRGKIVGPDELLWREFPVECALDFQEGKGDGKPFKVLASMEISQDRFINLEDEVSSISGVWDLMMIGGEVIDVESRSQILSNGAEVLPRKIRGTFVERGDAVCQLSENYRKQTDSVEAETRATFLSLAAGVSIERFRELQNNLLENTPLSLDEEKIRKGDDRYYPAFGLPKDSELVVRTNAIMEFLQSVNDEPPKTEKSLSTKERYSLLVLIAALCKQLNLDWKAKGISGAIAKATEEIGTPVTDDTIRKILNQIDEAITSRSK